MPTLPAGLEIVNPNFRRGPFTAAVFDFDGTLSLIREGWSGIMADLGLELLREQNLVEEPEETARHFLEEAVLRLSGKPSIYQMRRLAEEVQTRGGQPGDPEKYLHEFTRRLFAISDGRKADLATGRVPPSTWSVPGSHDLLANLRARGVALYLASGTDLAYVHEEMDLLQLTEFFGPHIYAPANDTPNFSKRDVVAMILRTHAIPGDRLLGFGDGYSETVEVKRAGGVAIAVASHEAGVPGVNPLKRRILIDLGADAVIPHYEGAERLAAWLFGGVE